MEAVATAAYDLDWQPELADEILRHARAASRPAAASAT